MEANTLPTQTTLTAPFGRRRPTSSMTAAPARGNSGISQMCARKYSAGLIVKKPRPPRSPFHQIHFVAEQRLAVPEVRDNNAQSHGRLRRRVGDNENRKCM